MVAGDVNGDGYTNDRAFIPTGGCDDPALASGMQSLLENGSPAARELSREAARKARGAQQLSGTVDLERVDVLFVQSGEGAHAAARNAFLPAFEPAWRGRSAAARLGN